MAFTLWSALRRKLFNGSQPKCLRIRGRSPSVADAQAWPMPRRGRSPSGFILHHEEVTVVGRESQFYCNLKFLSPYLKFQASASGLEVSPSGHSTGRARVARYCTLLGGYWVVIGWWQECGAYVGPRCLLAGVTGLWRYVILTACCGAVLDKGTVQCLRAG